jgi:hypothetical protein
MEKKLLKKFANDEGMLALLRANGNGERTPEMQYKMFSKRISKRAVRKL